MAIACIGPHHRGFIPHGSRGAAGENSMTVMYDDRRPDTIKRPVEFLKKVFTMAIISNLHSPRSLRLCGSIIASGTRGLFYGQVDFLEFVRTAE